jgi:hypothetical protein
MSGLLSVLAILLAAASAVTSILIAIDDTTAGILKATHDRGGIDIFGTDFDALLKALIADSRKNAIAASRTGLPAMVQGIAIALEWNKPA